MRPPARESSFGDPHPLPTEGPAGAPHTEQAARLARRLEVMPPSHTRLPNTMHTMSKQVPAAAGNLLETLLADATLRQRATASQSLSLTLTLEIDPDGQRRIDHPPWRDSASKAPTDQRPDPASDSGEGFVPVRAVAAPGRRSTPDTEYRLVGELGSGGTGVVYQAHQRGIDREVAVKVLRSELTDDPIARQRFLLEARTVGNLDHPNVIALHELAVGPDGDLFYSMKRVDGTSWDHAIDEMSLDENIETLLRLCDAIRYAHSRELIHRDIKPENVMIGRFGEVLLADWGLALALDGRDEDEHRSHAIGGTPAYMAPELAAGNIASQSIRTDIYLLGALLYRILTGHPPHHGNNLLDCVRRAARNEIRPHSLRGGWIEVAMTAMATKPEERYVSVEAFAQAIAREKEHGRSLDLVRRAERLIGKIGPAAKHHDFTAAEALVREALDLWPGNREAAEKLAQLQTEHARVATAAGDYDLALDLLAQADQADSELAARVRARRDSRREQAVRESKFSQLFLQSPDAGLMTRWSDGQIMEANDMFEQLTGFQADSVVGMKMVDLNLWADYAQRSEFVDQLSASGRVVDFEAAMLRSDGSPLHISLCANKVDLDGEAYILTTMRDIGQRIEARRELRRSRERLKELQRLAQLGTWELDVASGKVHWSDESVLIAGPAFEHGAPDLDAYLQTIHPDDRTQLVEAIRNAVEHRTAYELWIRHGGTSGSWKTVLVRGQPYTDETGKVSEIYGVAIDIERYSPS